MSIDARLKVLERLVEPPQPPLLEGSIEIHCIGGRSHVKGRLCKEHEACVFRPTPIMGRIRRQYLFNWQPGMRDPFDIG